MSRIRLQDAISAAQTGDIHTLTLAIKDQPELLKPTHRKVDLLKAAVIGHQLDTVRFLVEQGADIHAKKLYRDYSSPLIWCHRNAHAPCLSYLLSQDISLDFELDREPFHPLDARNGPRPAAPYLIRRIIESDSVECLRVLHEHGVDIFETTGLHQAPFQVAVQRAPHCLVFMLSILPSESLKEMISTPSFKITVSVNPLDEPLWITPLTQAARLNRFDIVQILMDAGADPWQKFQDGQTAEEIAITFNHHQHDSPVLFFFKALRARQEAELLSQHLSPQSHCVRRKLGSSSL